MAPPQTNQNAHESDGNLQISEHINRLAAENRHLKRSITYLRSQVDVLQKKQIGSLETYNSTLHKLVAACEYRDQSIESHLLRLSKYSALLASKIGLSDDDMQELEFASQLHDVGKAGIPEKILMKPGKLNDEEFSVMRLHTIMGGNMLANQKSEMIKRAREIALYHHERWDGSGYPVGLKRKHIPISARIVHLMDNFDALTSKRPHKEPYPVDVASDIIQGQSEKAFDPGLVDVLQDNLDSIIRIKAKVDTLEKMPAMNFNFSERDRLEVN
ncbi:MAG: HD domain-containing protein [Chitinivibrionales bacterium]|nr:HD domain-containing protein [Chitinivibrionales bacterium]